MLILELRVSRLPEGDENRGAYVESITRRVCVRHAKRYLDALAFGRGIPMEFIPQQEEDE